jgi:hypothetical protein
MKQITFSDLQEQSEQAENSLAYVLIVISTLN